jgi:hypothetical protein
LNRLACCSTGCKVLMWDDPFDSTIYSIASDNLYTIVCGVGVNGRVLLWDKRRSRNIGVCIVLSLFSWHRVLWPGIVTIVMLDFSTITCLLRTAVQFMVWRLILVNFLLYWTGHFMFWISQCSGTLLGSGMHSYHYIGCHGDIKFWYKCSLRRCYFFVLSLSSWAMWHKKGPETVSKQNEGESSIKLRKSGLFYVTNSNKFWEGLIVYLFFIWHGLHTKLCFQ